MPFPAGIKYIIETEQELGLCVPSGAPERDPAAFLLNGGCPHPPVMFRWVGIPTDKKKK
jgi:hypothetical protein